MEKKVSEALELIKRAEASKKNNPDPVYCELIDEEIVTLKRQISDQIGVSIDTLCDKPIVSYLTKQLVGKVESAYEDLEIAVGL